MTDWQLYLLFALLFQIAGTVGPDPKKYNWGHLLGRVLFKIIGIILAGMFGWAIVQSWMN